MALALNYEKYRQRSLTTTQLDTTCWLLVGTLLVIGAGVCTFLAIDSRAASGLVLLCGALTLLFILSTGMLLSDLLSAKVERPADLKTIRILMYLVDELGNRQEFVDEISALILEQGELYQYQANALILATKKFGVSPAVMAKRQQVKIGITH